MFQDPASSMMIWKVFSIALKSMHFFDVERLKQTMLSEFVIRFGFNQAIPFLGRVFGLELNNFDEMINAIEERSPQLLDNVQSPAKLLERGRHHRPVLCYTNTSSWSISMFIEYAMLAGQTRLVSRCDLLSATETAINQGGRIVTVCSSHAEMLQILPSLTLVLSARKCADSFAFFVMIPASVPQLSIFANCDIVVLDQPMHFGATFLSLVQTLEKASTIEAAKAKRIALFNAALSIFSRTVHNKSYFSLCDAVVSANFLQRNPVMKLPQIADFLVNLFYKTHTDIGCDRMKRIWRSVFESNDDYIRGILNSVGLSFPLNFVALGFRPVVADPIKKAYIKHWTSGRLVESISMDLGPGMVNRLVQRSVPKLWRFEKGVALMTVRAIQAGMRTSGPLLVRKFDHLLSGSGVACLALMFEPVVFLRTLKSSGAAKARLMLHEMSLVLDCGPSDDENSQIVEGLVCVGGCVEGGRLKVCDVVTELPEMRLRAVATSGVTGYVEVGLFCNHEKVDSVWMVGDPDQDLPLAFIQFSDMSPIL
jgi:hypothetical protein